MADTPDKAADDPSAAARSFSAELTYWRDVRGWSRTALAKEIGYSRPYVSKVESGAEPPSQEFAAAAETALDAGGALERSYRDFAMAKRGRTPRQRVTVDPTDHTGSLIVEHDDAELRFDGHTYRLTQRRRLVNDGAEPVGRYLIRISVDRYPRDPERSRQLYSENPLTWDELDLHAWYGSNRAQPMQWTVHHDRDAFKEVWLLFAHDGSHFPLYPGEETWIEYEYTVSYAHWGNWFQRAVRLPTRRLSVRLDFPADLQPAVWGLHTSMTAETAPFRTPIHRQDHEDRQVYSWSTDDPPLHARYRLEWNFRGQTDPAQDAKPSEIMRKLGVVQDDDPALHQPARLFDLPAEAPEADRVLEELASAVERIGQVHVFGKGMGIAAPQLGIDRAAALVRTPDGETITLLNPKIIETSGETDEQYEGCLSFFDVRGQVPRPLVIHVEHTDRDGRKKITIFDHGAARLIAHEVDHLDGLLYTDRMRTGVRPIPVEQYRGTGTTWKY